MPRPLRLDYAGAWFHITARGNERQAIFIDDADRVRFMNLLAAARRRFGMICHAYCLMGNHYHLVVESADGRMSPAIQYLNGSYAAFFNRRRDRVGHLLQGRFHSSLIERDVYLLESVRYVELNPCRAGLVGHPIEWEWSSFGSRFTRGPSLGVLSSEAVLDCFGSGPERTARYQAFVVEGLEREPCPVLQRGDPVIGSPGFMEKHANRARRASDRCDVPRFQRLSDRPSLAPIFLNTTSRLDRKRLSVEACLRYGYSFVAVARHVGVHYTAVSRWIRAAKCDDAGSDPSG
jgi:REP element-mobilizing transposase RayT